MGSQLGHIYHTNGIIWFTVRPHIPYQRYHIYGGAYCNKTPYMEMLSQGTSSLNGLTLLSTYYTSSTVRLWALYGIIPGNVRDESLQKPICYNSGTGVSHVGGYHNSIRPRNATLCVLYNYAFTWGPCLVQNCGLFGSNMLMEMFEWTLIMVMDVRYDTVREALNQTTLVSLSPSV